MSRPIFSVQMHVSVKRLSGSTQVLVHRSMLLSRSRSGPEEGINTKTRRSMSKLKDSSEIKQLSRGPVSPGSCSWHHWRGQPSFPQRSWLPVWTERCPSQREARCQSLRLFLRGAEKSNQTGLFHTSKSVRLVSHSSDSAENTVGHVTSTCSNPWLKLEIPLLLFTNFLEVIIYHFYHSAWGSITVTWKWAKTFEFTPQVHPPKISDLDVRGQAFWRTNLYQMCIYEEAEGIEWRFNIFSENQLSIWD